MNGTGELRRATLSCHMPSLSTNNDTNDDRIGTYHFIIPPNSTINETDFHPVISIRKSIVFLGKNVSVLSLITILVYIVGWIAIYIVILYPNYYSNHELYYFFDFWSNNVALFLFYFVFVIYLPGFNTKTLQLTNKMSNSFGHKYLFTVDAVICVIIYLVVDTIILFIIITNYEYSNASNVSTLWTHKSVLNFDCDVYLCEGENVGFLFFLVIIPNISPIIHVTILIIRYLFNFYNFYNCCTCEKFSNLRIESALACTNKLALNNELGVPMIEYGIRQTDIDENVNKINNIDCGRKMKVGQTYHIIHCIHPYWIGSISHYYSRSISRLVNRSL